MEQKVVQEPNGLNYKTLLKDSKEYLVSKEIYTPDMARKIQYHKGTDST